MKMKFGLVMTSLTCIFLVGCMNMPTQPSQITGAYTSGAQYRGYTCGDMIAEERSLARRENQLVIAQEQRVKSSKAQAFWYGIGNGDGIEASELANVRGDREALRVSMERDGCN